MNTLRRLKAAISYSDGMNLYSSYFAVNGTDPSGMLTECEWICGWAAIVNCAVKCSWGGPLAGLICGLVCGTINMWVCDEVCTEIDDPPCS